MSRAWTVKIHVIICINTQLTNSSVSKSEEQYIAALAEVAKVQAALETAQMQTQRDSFKQLDPILLTYD